MPSLTEILDILPNMKSLILPFIPVLIMSCKAGRRFSTVIRIKMSERSTQKQAEQKKLMNTHGIMTQLFCCLKHVLPT